MMNEASTIPVTHIITGLNTGGAEMMLYKLLKSVDLHRFPSRVISMTEIGDVGSQIETLGIPVSALGMQSGQFSYSDIKKLELQIKKENPTVVQTWMYHADLLGGWAARNAGVQHIAWNIRNSTLDWRKSKASTLATVGLCAVLSHFIPKQIVVCSESAARIHQRIGYATSKLNVIPNGFDLTAFKPNLLAGQSLRKELNISLEAPVVGLAARFDEQKDHRTFFKSAGIVLKEIPNVQFLLCGDGITRENRLMMQWLSAAGPQENFHLLGRQKDMAEFHAACTVSVSSSAYGESFSNVIGEAMASGVPCVSTRVGGAEEVMGDTGRLVPPGYPEKLAGSILEILKMPERMRLEMGLLSRQRIIENFEISHIADRYMRFWEELSVTN